MAHVPTPRSASSPTPRTVARHDVVGLLGGRYSRRHTLRPRSRRFAHRCVPFAGFSVEAFPTTSLTAYALTAAADRAGDPVLIEEVGLALRNALFEEGLDIGRPEVIGSMAARFDLEPPLDAETTSVAVQADWGAGRARGVVGSPHFFTEDGADWFFALAWRSAR